MPDDTVIHAMACDEKIAWSDHLLAYNDNH